jgi:hypothetical protein
MSIPVCRRANQKPQCQYLYVDAHHEIKYIINATNQKPQCQYLYVDAHHEIKYIINATNQKPQCQYLYVDAHHEIKVRQPRDAIVVGRVQNRIWKLRNTVAHDVATIVLSLPGLLLCWVLDPLDGCSLLLALGDPSFFLRILKGHRRSVCFATKFAKNTWSKSSLHLRCARRLASIIPVVCIMFRSKPETCLMVTRLGLSAKSGKKQIHILALLYTL